MSMNTHNTNDAFGKRAFPPLPPEAHQRAVPRADIYQKVTDSLIALIEKGVKGTPLPWSVGAVNLRPIRATGQRYQGINTVLLWAAALEADYTSPMWMTFRQALALKGRVKKGEKGTAIVYADRFTRTETGEDGQDAERSIPFLKGYTVFNVDQIEDLPPIFYAHRKPATDSTQAPIEAAEAFFAATGARIEHGGCQAFYMPRRDFIQMPPFESFRSPELYCAVKAHELVHWTGHPSRTARDFGSRFDMHAYAFEELIAELGAAFLCADLGIASHTLPDHASYMANWLTVLKDDKKAIFTAATQAQRAVDYLHGLTNPAPAEPDATGQDEASLKPDA